MQTVAGAFRSIEAARRAASRLRRSRIPSEHINQLYPGASEAQIHSAAPGTDQWPGIGAAIGGAVGAALGAVGGFELGIGATTLIPGVGPVLAIGVAGAALLGAGGAFGGATLGDAAEQHYAADLPANEVFFYEEALRQGRSLIIVVAHDAAEKDRAREVLARSGAESLDATREAWWIGLRDGEEEHYKGLGENFAVDQEAYREGFEAAVRPECRGKTMAEARDCLDDVDATKWESKPFLVGFKRGMALRQRMGGRVSTG